MQRGVVCFGVVGAIALLCALTGCKKGGFPARSPVSGRVLLDQKPVEGALVLFHATSDVPQVTRPQGSTDREGRFQLTSMELNDGAHPGEYAITVVLRELQPDGDEMVRNGRNLLPARYASPDTSGLTATIKSGVNELPPIELTSDEKTKP